MPDSTPVSDPVKGVPVREPLLPVVKVAVIGPMVQAKGPTCAVVDSDDVNDASMLPPAPRDAVPVMSLFAVNVVGSPSFKKPSDIVAVPGRIRTFACGRTTSKVPPAPGASVPVATPVIPLAEMWLPMVAVPPVNADAVAMPGVAAPAAGAASATPPNATAHAPAPVTSARPVLVHLFVVRVSMTATVTDE
jgi:hypothetical protein